MNPNSTSASWCDRAAVGSSRMSSRAEPDSERAISTIWRSPTRSVPTMASGSISTSSCPRIVCGAIVHRTPRDQATAVGHASQRDVLGDRQRRGILEFLEDDGHAQLTGLARGEHRVSRAVDHHLPGLGLVVAGDDLDEGRLAGSVLAQEREHGAASGVEVHPMEDLDATEGLADLASLKLEGHRLASSVESSQEQPASMPAWPGRPRGCCPC